MKLTNQGYFYNYRKTLFCSRWKFSHISIDSRGYLTNGSKRFDLDTCKFYPGVAPNSKEVSRCLLENNIDTGLFVYIKSLNGCCKLWILFPDYNTLQYNLLFINYYTLKNFNFVVKNFSLWLLNISYIVSIQKNEILFL